MTLDDFLKQLRSGETVSFQDSLAVINDNYHYQPSQFSNGLLINAAGTNEGSCRLFAFAQLHDLNESQTLNLFGDYYRDVLNSPDGTDHGNIRNFMQHGWAGIVFQTPALSIKSIPHGNDHE